MKIQPLFILIFLLICTVFTANAQEQAAQKFKKLQWLTGEWQRSNSQPGQSGYEEWTRVSDTKLTGKGVTMEGKDTIFVEQLELSVQGEDIFYIVSVTGDPTPVAFKLTAISENAFTCENPAHNFPKKIAYTKKGNKVSAIVSGDGKILDYEFAPKPKH